MNKGFTLIEMLIVIVLLGILGTVVFLQVSTQLKRGRDARRLIDMENLVKAINTYYIDNGKLPQPKNSKTTCVYNTSCYVYSTDTKDWIEDLKPYLKTIPRDPINNIQSPWADNRYSYSYGNVFTNHPIYGDQYDLTMQFENKNEPLRCENRHYRFYIDNREWCGPYSKYLFEASP